MCGLNIPKPDFDAEAEADKRKRIIEDADVVKDSHASCSGDACAEFQTPDFKPSFLELNFAKIGAQGCGSDKSELCCGGLVCPHNGMHFLLLLLLLLLVWFGSFS